MIYRTISSGRVLAKIYRDLGDTIQISDWEQDAFEWIGEALSYIGSGNQLETKTAKLNLVSHKAEVPSDLVALNVVFYASSEEDVVLETHELHVISVGGTKGLLSISINGVAYTEGFSGSVSKTLSNWIRSHSGVLTLLGFFVRRVKNTIELRTFNSESNNHVVNSTVASVANDLIVSISRSTSQIVIPTAVKKERLSKSSSSVHLGVSKPVRCTDPTEGDKSYVLNPNYIHTGYETGLLYIVYKGAALDENGYPMVPDNTSFSEALFWYILKMLMMRGWKHPSGIDWVFADNKWKFYCTQARNSAQMPDEDDYNKFLKQWVRLTPSYDLVEDYFDRDNTVDESLFKSDCQDLTETMLYDDDSIMIYDDDSIMIYL